MKKALITGVNGQDGSYLSELLLEKGYEVHGLRRKSSIFNTARIDHLINDWHKKDNRFILHYGDLTDSLSISRILNEIKPDEVYNLGAMSHVYVSFQNPENTANVDGLGTLRILESLRLLKLNKTKFYQASTSELYGLVQETPQNEKTPFYPRSPYGVAKLYSYWITKNYREAYGMYTCNGILFNHESARRGETFVTRKITLAAAKIAKGIQDILYIGNLDAKRDWGHAKDYVYGMWLMMQQTSPDDYVLATGTTTTVREFITKTFMFLGIEIEFKGSGDNEYGVVSDCKKNYKIEIGKKIVEVDPKYYRPAEVDLLVGDSQKAYKELGWKHKITLDKLIEEMIENDLNNI